MHRWKMSQESCGTANQTEGESGKYTARLGQFVSDTEDTAGWQNHEKGQEASTQALPVSTFELYMRHIITIY